MMKRWFVTALLLVLQSLTAGAAGFTPVAPEAVGMSSAHLEYVDVRLEGHIANQRIPGAVVLVLKKGQAVYHKAFGLRDREANLPMENDSLFRIASMTKAITSVGVMMLAEDGLLSLDDPLSKHIPEFSEMQVLRSSNDGETIPARRPITVRHLLNHTSGITYRFQERPYLSSKYTEVGISDGLSSTDGTIGEMVKKLATLPLLHHPGDTFAYGLSTDVLGYLIEVVSGLGLDEFFDQRIFQPLGMEDTFFYVPEAKQSRMSAVYRRAGGGLVRLPETPITNRNLTYSASFQYEGPTTYFSGGAGLISTALDYALFLQSLLDAGGSGQPTILGRDSVREMTTNSLPESVSFEFELGFEIATSLRSLRSPGTYAWGGFFYTEYLVDPSEELVIVYMSQMHPFGHLSVWTDVVQAVYESIKETRLNWVPTTRGFRITWRTHSVVPLPGAQLFPSYRVLQSADLSNWVNVYTRSSSARGTVGRSNRTFTPEEAMGVFRIEIDPDFSGFDLDGRSLRFGDFAWADLSGASLVGADLRGANLRGANLQGANLARAKLTDAQGLDLDQEGIVLNGATLPDGTIVP